MSDTSASLLRTLPSPAEIAAVVERDGYGVFADCIEPSVLDELRGFWRDYLPAAAKRRVARGVIRLGEPNFVGYSNTRFWRLYRGFDYLWNPPIDPPTRALCLELHRVRNLAQGLDADSGLRYDPERYGVYGAASWYPPNGGFCAPHKDGHGALPILHFMVSLTFRGIHYSQGGFTISDRHGRLVDVEAELTPGAVLFFDGRLEHAVAPVAGGEGRLAVFAIPTYFASLSDVPPSLIELARLVGRLRRRLARGRGH